MVQGLDTGPVRTRFRTRAFPAEDPTDLTKPEAVSVVFVYLISGETDNVTGKTFTLDDFK